MANAAIVLLLTPGTPGDIQLRGYHESGEIVPFEGMGFNWPHSVISRMDLRDGRVEYTITRLDDCACGRAMWPLPFRCDACCSSADVL